MNLLGSMPPARRRADVDLAVLHGWSGLFLAYGSVQAPLVAGLARSRAGVNAYVTSPLVAAPLLAASAIGMAVATPLLSRIGIDANGLLHFTLGTAVSAALGFSWGRSSGGRQREPGSYRRGAMVSPASDTARRPGPRNASSREISLGGSIIPLADETKHFKFIGTTGTGKSTAIRDILSTVLPRGDRAVIADPDGGYLQRFYDPSRGDVVLNPFDVRSRRWDLFAEIENAADVDQLARSLIPDDGGADRSWRGYARTFFTAVTRQAHAAGITDVSELYRLLVVAEADELRELVRGTPAQPFLNEQNGRMFDSIRSVTSSAVGALEHVAHQRSEGFSIRKWVGSDQPGVLFIPYKAGQIASLRSTISAWMRLAIFEAMNGEQQPDERDGEGAKRLWFVVDELDALGPIDGLKDALARLRKFGGRCVLGFQSIAQVSSTYGQGDAHTIVENCANTLILRCSASEGGGTARFASQLIGDREVVRTTVSRSQRQTEFFGSISHSEHVNIEPAVLPAQIEQLPDLAGYLKQASQAEWQRIRLEAVQHWQDQRPASGAGRPVSRESPGSEYGLHG